MPQIRSLRINSYTWRSDNYAGAPGAVRGQLQQIGRGSVLWRPTPGLGMGGSGPRGVGGQEPPRAFLLKRTGERCRRLTPALADHFHPPLRERGQPAPAALPVRASPVWPSARTSRLQNIPQACLPPPTARNDKAPGGSREKLRGNSCPNSQRLHFRPLRAPRASIRRVVEHRVLDGPSHSGRGGAGFQ